MAIGLGTSFGLTVDIVLIVFTLALASLMIWQDRARRSTQYFAFCMVIFALYGTVHTVWQVTHRFEINPEPVMSLSTSLYVLGIIMLFNFLSVFAEFPRRVQLLLIGSSSLTAAIFVPLIWLGYVYKSFTPLSGGNGYNYHYTPVGMLGLGLLLGFMLGFLVLLFRLKSERSRPLTVPMFILLTGVLTQSLHPSIRELPIYNITLMVVVLLLGYTVLQFRVYRPLKDLNNELAAKIDELDRAMHRKAQFLANMSHELRTPLNSIIGYAELVVNRTYGDLTPVQDDRLQKVTRNGHLLLELINDVLDLSKIEAGRLNLRFARVPTIDLLDSLCADHEMQAKAKGLQLMRSYGQLPALWVDQDRGRQIVENLISNAVKYTERGVVIVRGYYDLTRQQVVISVTDTGPGIPPDQQEHLFDLYAASGDDSARAYEGIGLGLALADQLTSMHGGKLWFETEADRGSTFHVALPAFDDSLEIRRPVLPRAQNGGPIVLAIDDDLEALEVLQGQLEAVGYLLYGACTANDGLKLAHELKPSLITLDIAIPDLNGWQILAALRADPITAKIPVLIVSARDDENAAQRHLANGFLSKPVQAEVLLKQISELLGQPHPSEINRRQTPPIRRREEVV